MYVCMYLFIYSFFSLFVCLFAGDIEKSIYVLWSCYATVIIYMTKSLAKEPFNELSNIKCPTCQSTNWYRKVNKIFHCKKCAREWEE